MAGSNNNNRALVPMQGHEVGIHNQVADPNNLPILQVQENKGIFKHTSDDGKTQEIMDQKQQMVLRGVDTHNQTVRVMEGRDDKIIVQQNEEGKRLARTQEQTKKSIERTATSETQKEMSQKQTKAVVEMKDETKDAEVLLEKNKVLQHKTEDAMLLHAASERDRLARQNKQGQQQAIHEKDEIELHAQVSFDGSKQYSGKF